MALEFDLTGLDSITVMLDYTEEGWKVATFTKFYQFVEDLGLGVHNLDTDILKVMLTNTAPVATNEIKANITEISAGFGYSAGGATVTNNVYSQTAGVAKLVGDDVTFTATGGSIGPWRYAVLYNDTPTSPDDPLIGWWDYTSTITITNGNSKTIDFNVSNELGQLQ